MNPEPVEPRTSAEIYAGYMAIDEQEYKQRYVDSLSRDGLEKLAYEIGSRNLEALRRIL